MAISYPFICPADEKTVEFFKKEQVYLGHLRRFEGVYRSGSQIKIASQVIVERYATMPAGGFISMGSFSYSLSQLQSRVKIGRYCSIAKGCSVLGIEHPTNWISTHTFAFRKHYHDSLVAEFGRAPAIPPFKSDLGKIEIGHDVWIGQDVKLRAGIKIGHGAIIASGAVVTKDVPPYAIYGGVSAKLIRYRFSDALIDRLLRMEWWRFHPSDFAGLPVDRPEEFLDGLQKMIENGEISEWNPRQLDLAHELYLFRGPE